MCEDWFPMGAPAHLPDVRCDALLRQLTEQARDATRAGHQPSCYRIGRAGRALALLLSGRFVRRILTAAYQFLGVSFRLNTDTPLMCRRSAVITALYEVRATANELIDGNDVNLDVTDLPLGRRCLSATRDIERQYRAQETRRDATR